MNKIGIHYGSFLSNWMDEQFQLIEKVKILGFDVLEFGAAFLLTLDEDGLKKFRDEADRHGVKLVLSAGLTTEQDIACFNADYRAAGSALLKQIAAAMGKIGITDCSGIVFTAWNGKICSYEEKQARWENSVSVMKDVIKSFEENNVYLNVEVTNRFENYLINDCEEGLKYIEEVGSPNLGLHLDTFHMNVEENSFVSAIMKGAPKMRYFHIGENNRKMPGLGMLPWKTIFDAIKLSGYMGPISMEPFVKPGGEVGSAVSLYRNIMDISDYENDLRRSLAFVRAHLAE